MQDHFTGGAESTTVATELNNDLINELALRYAQTKSDETFRELFEYLRPMVHNEAMKAERDRGIPRDTMLSHFNEGIWRAVDGEAAKNFDGSSNFSQRFHTFFNRRLIDEVKYQRADKRTALVESLDKLQPHVSGDNRSMPTGGTYVEAISAPRTTEQEFFENHELTETFAGFRGSNERYGQVIEMLYRGHTNDEIAKACGYDSYDRAARRLVFRARESFRAHLAKRKMPD